MAKQKGAKKQVQAACLSSTLLHCHPAPGLVQIVNFEPDRHVKAGKFNLTQYCHYLKTQVID